MSPQFILRIAGIALLVIALLFVLLAIHYFVTNDIRGVMDDLSGKARAKGVASTRARAATEARRNTQARTRSDAKVTSPAVKKGAVVEAEASPPVEPEVIEPQFAVAIDDEDEMGTVVVDVDFGAPRPSTPQGETGNTSAPDEEVGAGTVAFRVTRSIILCDSNQIITAD